MSTLATNEAIGKAWRTGWQDLGEFRYLNTATHAALPKSTVAAVEESLAANAMPRTIRGSHYFDAPTMEDGARGSFGCFVASTPEETVRVSQELKARQIIVSLREGRIRVSPYLFNTEEDIDALIGALVG
jgi:hypothetical protein